MSSVEAEYVSLSACCAQVLWLRTQLTDYGFYFDKIPMYCDSKAAIAISCNPVQHSRTKHIDVRYHFIKEHVEKGIVELFFVGTEYQLADLFTKALSEDRFKYLVRRLGMRCLTPDELERFVKESCGAVKGSHWGSRLSWSPPTCGRGGELILRCQGTRRRPQVEATDALVIPVDSLLPVRACSYALSWKPYQGDSLNLPNHRAQDDRERQIKMIQVKEMMQDKDLKNSKLKDKGSRSRLQGMNEQSHYKQDKNKQVKA
ncbi:hypothetical protein Tco_0163678 [Tanacetum coccineum]